MTIYLLYVASPILVAVILSMMTTMPITQTEKWRKTYLIVCGIIMFLMIGLRHSGLGSDDTQFYVNLYEVFGTKTLSQTFSMELDMEPGYLLCSWILSHVFSDGQWLLVFSGLFFSITVCRFVYKNCKNMPLALLAFNALGLFNFMVQGLRQAIAMCICLWALEQIKKKRTLASFLLVALATTFHASAIVFAVLYLISKLKITLRGLFVFSVLSSLAISFLPNLFVLINRFMNDSYAIGDSALSGGVVAILIDLVIIVFGLVYIDTDDPHYPMFLYMAVLTGICMIMRNTVNGIIERVADYFAFGQMVIFANGSHAIRNPNVKVFINYAAGLLLLGVAVYKATYSSLVPYVFFWQ